MAAFGINTGGSFSTSGALGPDLLAGTGIHFAEYAPAPQTSFPSPTAVSVSTGVSPLETSYSLYGHIIPLSVFGKGRIGGEIIAGPWVENGLASFIISFGVPADPSGTRKLLEIAFDSEVVWTGTLTGAGTPSSGGFTTEPFTVRFYDGTLTQAADGLETAHFGSDAVAYRPQILLAFENLPLANTKFRKIPYVAALISDTSGDDVNLGEAFERLAYSPWVGYTSAQFETVGITDALVNGGLIIASQAEFLATIQQFGRFYPTWDILQTDKLRIVDRGSDLTADISLDKSRLIDNVTIVRQEPNSVPSILELSTIDPDADYTIVPSRAQRPRVPVAVTTAVQTQTAYLPVIMDSFTRAAVVTYTKYSEEQGRKNISFTAMAYGLQLEPGALVEITGLGGDFQTETFKLKETLHGANYVVECNAQSILLCTAGPRDPHLGNVVLLLGFEGADASTGAPGMTDESPAMNGTATAYGNAQIDTAQFKFGTSSYLGDGSGDGLLFPPDPQADWQLAPSSGDQFTVEAWVRPNTTTPGSAVIVGQGGVIGFNCWLFWTVSNELAFWGSSNANAFNWPVATSSGMSWVSGQWYHVAADRDSSNQLRVYRDGVMVGSVNTGAVGMADVSSNGAPLGVGRSNKTTGSVDFSWNGWLDEIRITKGLARYASDSGFTVPAAAYPRT